MSEPFVYPINSLQSSVFPTPTTSPVSSQNSRQEIKTLVFFHVKSKLPDRKRPFPTHLKTSMNPNDFRRELKQIATNICLDRAKVPSISQMSMIAISRRDFIEGMKGMRRKFMAKTEKPIIQAENGSSQEDNSIDIPLLTSKLTLQFDSQRRGQESTTGQTGTLPSPRKRVRYSSDLEDSERPLTFSQQYKTIYSFLESLPGPICLVTHSGFRYGFHVLFGELRINNLFGRAFPPATHFMDTYFGFIRIEAEFKGNIEKILATKFGSENAPQIYPWLYLRAEGSPVAALRRFGPECFIKNAGEPWKFTKDLEEFEYSKEALYGQIIGGMKAFDLAEECAISFMLTAMAFDKKFLEYLDQVAVTLA